MQCTCGNAEVRLTEGSDDNFATVICIPCGYAQMITQVKPDEIYEFRAKVKKLLEE